MEHVFNLKYYCKQTGKMYEGRRVCLGEYILRDPDSGLKKSVTYHSLCKNFSFDKNNKNNSCERNKKIWSRMKLSRRKIA